MELFRRTFAEINIENLLHNWQVIKDIAGDDRFICPMVKANAYGHGDVEVSYALEREGAKVLGVCLIEEGLAIRGAGVQSEILVFRGFDKRGAEKIIEYQMTPVVSTWEQIKALDAVADEPVKVHLKFNTGMNRLGFEITEAEKLREYFKRSKKLKLKAVLTHLACSDDAYLDDGVSARQAEKFMGVKELFSDMDVYAHLLNSGGIAAYGMKSDTHKKLPAYLTQVKWGFRPGLMLYGYHAAPEFNFIKIRPVMSFKSVVNNVRKLMPGDSVSYGASWVAQRESDIAVVPLGYADGAHRILSNCGHAMVAGYKAPIVGKICMDFLMLDITDLKKIDHRESWLEEEVVLFGQDEKNNFISADDVAQEAKTISWEVLTSVGERVPRHFKGLKKS